MRTRPAAAASAAGLILALVVAMTIGVAPEASAAPFVVTKTADTADGTCDADCSLREAVIAANTAPGPDSIALSAETYVLGIPGTNSDVNGDLDITDLLTITGAGAGRTFIDAGGATTGDRALHVSSPGAATVSDITVRNGMATGSGGGLRVSVGGSLVLSNSVVTGNSAGTGGGGLYVAGTATLVGVTVNGNTSGGAGGGIRVSPGSATMRNVTVSGNTTADEGGGVQFDSDVTGGELDNVTIVGNTADSDGDSTGSGGGLLSDVSSVTVRNSIVAMNADASPGSEGPDCSGAFTSQGHNLIGNNAGCPFTSAAGDQVGTPVTPIDPKLGALADNGGPTPTHALLKGSPAIDAGDPAAPGSGGSACEATDQRGLPRSACDIGAYELVLCAKAPVNRIGTEGKDVLAGTTGPDGLLGLGGNDKLKGLGGKDGLCGGPGKDTLRGGGGKDRLDGGKGKDLCVGQGGRDKAKACETEKSI